MIIGILGSLGNREVATTGPKASNCGNGKTATLTKFLYDEHERKDRKVICNYHTWRPGARDRPDIPSWAEYRTSQEIFDIWLDVDEDHPDFGAVVGLTELTALINSAARDTKLIAYIEKCLNQRRKNGWDIIWDGQVLGSLDKRFRDMTEYLYKPLKFHCAYDPRFKAYLPTEACLLDNCDERHQVIVYIEQSPYPLTVLDLKTPQLMINTWEIGELYNTREKMRDILHYNKKWENK
jgi:hypothetical protein